MSRSNILVIDDDAKLRAVLKRCFAAEGYAVSEAASEREAQDRISRESFDLITLDINLGETDGFDVARLVRKASDIPIIMITGRADLIDRVVGLEIGADDYITKPFHIREVLARVRSVLRRSALHGSARLPCGCTPPCRCGAAAAGAGGTRFRFDGLTVSIDRFELTGRRGEPCELTSGEFKLLRIFLENPGRPLSRETLMDMIGGTEWTPLDRTIDNQVARLRKKIERDPRKPALIKTVRGIGYQFTAQVERLAS